MDNPNLPVYVAQVGLPRAQFPEDAASFVLVRAILNMGAESNYITAHKAHKANAQVFHIQMHEIVGAGRTSTSAFARFELKMGG